MIGLPTAPIVSVILAMNKEGVIGADGTIPWSNKKDLQFYKHNTLCKVVIIGRKTYESLPDAAFAARTYIVVTRDELKSVQRRGVGVVYFANSTETAFMSAVQMCREDPKLQGVVFAGGASIYKDAEEIGLVDEVLLTLVDEPTPTEAKELVLSPYKRHPCNTTIFTAFEKEGEKVKWGLYTSGSLSQEQKLYLASNFRSNLKLAGIM